MTLKVMMAAFWSGYVRWSADANAELRFWLMVPLFELEAPISADTLEVLASNLLLDTSVFKRGAMSFMASDASDYAGGGGMLRHGRGGLEFAPNAVFFAPLPKRIRGSSSTLREITTVLRMLQAFGRPRSKCIIVFTDSWGACAAIRRGSKKHDVQSVAREIFIWSLRNKVVVNPCWVSRDKPILKEADRRSRWVDSHEDRTPRNVFAEANRMARRAWGRQLSFDRQASSANAMPPRGMGERLPFNARWHQPGCQGVDMFLQPVWSWRQHINYVYPAEPTTGRVLTFLQEVRARAVVVCKAGHASGKWWSNFVRRSGPGVVESKLLSGFLLTAVDHSCRSSQTPMRRHPPTYTMGFWAGVQCLMSCSPFMCK